MDFAKIYNLKDGSILLITKETDKHAKAKKAQLAFHFGEPGNNYRTAMRVGYLSVEERDQAYDLFTVEMAQEIFDKKDLENEQKQ